MPRTRRCMLTLFLCLWCCSLFGQANRPKVAIKTFENPANFSHSTIGDGLTEILTTELQNTGKFDVLERTNVDEITKEMNFGDSEYAKSSTFAQKGHMLGAQYLLMGKVTNFSYTEHLERRQKINLLGPNTIQTVYQQQADVRVDFRLIDVSSGETVISQAGEAHKTNTSQTSEMATWYRCTTSGSITAELQSSLIGRATTEAVKDIVQKLNALSQTVRERSADAALSASLESLAGAKGQLVAEEGGGLWIVGGLGSASGLQKGDRLKLAHESVVKDRAGKVVYRKLINVGSMQVTDVSQPDHAEVRWVPSTSGSATPQTNDIVTVDMEYARSLRGGGGGSAAASSAAPGISSNSQLEEHLRRAESYMNDRFWSQALDEYAQAAKVNPNEPRVLQGQAEAHYMLGDFLEGDETSDKLLQAGGTLAIPVAHYHSMGLCVGQLIIQRGKLTYKTDKSDGFELGPQDLQEIAVRRLSKPFMANEAAPNWPVLAIRLRDAGGHEKKYEILPYVYAKQHGSTGKNFASAFEMDDNDIMQMRKLEYSLVTMIQKYVE
jgi:curli biogenesis system outer membrane secretion channel CsgG